jgi:hypothetical protein
LKHEYPGTWVKGANAREYRAKGKIFHNGEWWFARRIALAYLTPAVAWPTLADWARSKKDGGGCPLLGGKSIRTHSLVDGNGCERVYYAKKSLDEVNEAAERLDSSQEFPDILPMADAARNNRMKTEMFRRKVKALKIKPQKILVKTSGGRRVYRDYVSKKLYLNPQAAADASASVDNGASFQPTDRQRFLLQAMHRLKAVSEETRKKLSKIVLEAESAFADPDSFKHDMATLAAQQFIGTKTGRAGGSWLLAKGLEIAQIRRNSAS